ncbi:hypothetical protein AALP_AA3G308000 [Arabis alpina]|uniref:DDE Tnp4 domain-containing protein n=1 Tax=Arabis alpina TaxID=50452 RepID=A0A087HCS8_ARAAL|nr:hypothetical protein AALP_AA3G308000 [Arabis alpina]
MVAGAGNSSLIGKSIKRKPNKLPLKDPLLHRLTSAASVTSSFLKTNDLFLPPSQSLRLESLLSSLPIPPSPSSSTTTWFNRFVTSAVEDNDPRWNLYFRMSKPTFFNLLSILDFSSLPSSSFAAAIFRLAHNASYKSLLLRFEFDSVHDASRAFFTVCKLINEKLGQVNDLKPDYSPRLLPNCCGVLGFGRFEVQGKVIGSKGSVIVQALVDSNGRFVDISSGWPSTMKLEAIFRQTKLFLESESFLEGDMCKLGNGMLVGRYVLGDSCLPLLPWLVTRYDSNEDDDKCREFNNVVETALRSVEVVFDKVRAKWRILDKKWKLETMEFLPFVVTTGCLLHNFLVDSGDDYHSEEECVNGAGDAEMRNDEEDEEEEEEETRRSEGEVDIGSRRIRDAIAENLSRMSSIMMN